MTRWHADCKSLDLTSGEQDGILHCAWTCAAALNHDERSLGGPEKEAPYQAAMDSCAQSTAAEMCNSIDLMHTFCKTTGQEDIFESARSYLIECVKQKQLAQSYITQTIARLAAKFKVPEDRLGQAYLDEARRMRELASGCDCPVCLVASIMGSPACSDDVKKILDKKGAANYALRGLHEHIKGRAAINDLLNGG